jgi:hypothetical protein
VRIFQIGLSLILLSLHPIALRHQFCLALIGIYHFANMWVLKSQWFTTSLTWLKIRIISVHTTTASPSRSSVSIKHIHSAPCSEHGIIIVYTAVLAQVAETVLESMISYQFLVNGWGDPHVDSFVLNFQPLLNTICKQNNIYEAITGPHLPSCSWSPSSMLLRLENLDFCWSQWFKGCSSQMYMHHYPDSKFTVSRDPAF